MIRDYLTNIDSKAFASIPIKQTASGFSGTLCASMQTHFRLMFFLGGEHCVDSRISSYRS
jgi:hypothetical protein